MKNILFAVLCILAMASCTPKQISLNDLQGTWAPSKDENAAFTIEGNTITYFEEEIAQELKLQNSTVELLEEGHHISSWKIQKATKDSLVLVVEGSEVIKYVKISD
ncbi:hypothetical protein ACLI1A_12220 [Flavobacterium sp. RHBU_3]|uniref:hypothetical protein n=1 Tax=Flavobacterium sp. RHBU_3 TaxID=3391184 RepID=UPI003985364D